MVLLIFVVVEQKPARCKVVECQFDLILMGVCGRLCGRLFYDSRTPVRKPLDYWPSFPIIIRSTLASTTFTLLDRGNGENIVAALVQRDRVFKVELKNLTSYSLLINSFTEVM
jgi:hypothetical protein